MSEVLFNELESGIRVDSELYQKKYLEFFEHLQKLPLTTLKREALFVKKGIFDIKAEVYSATGIPFVRIGNLKKGVIDESDIIFIPEEENAKFADTSLVRNDIILSKTGGPAASLVTVPVCNASQDTVAIKLAKEASISSHFVVTYLNTTQGLGLMRRWFTGNVQMHLNLEDCRTNLLIPIFSAAFQTRIGELFEESIAKITDSKALYRQAEADLLHHLGLPTQPPRPVLHEVMSDVKTLDQAAVAAGRWDAEFYETRHDSLAHQLKAQPWVTLGSACRAAINRGVQPEFVEGGAVFVVASKAVRAHGLDLRPDETTSTEFFTSSKAAKGRIEQYDVLLNGTGRGTLGRAGIHTSATPALADNHVTILRLYPGGLNPFYLMLFLNSWPGQLQSEQWQCGSSGQTELYPNQMEQFIIPDLPPAQQAAIAGQVQRSFALRTESEALLTRAKQAVEVAIEQGEAAGLAWLAN